MTSAPTDPPAERRERRTPARGRRADRGTPRRGPGRRPVLRRPHERRRAAAPADPRALAHPGEREAARLASPRPGTGTAPPTTALRSHRLLRPGARLRRVGRRLSPSGAGLIAWWHIPGTTKLEWDAAANGLLNDHLRLHKQGRETRQARGTILALCLAGLAAAVAAMGVFAPWWAWALAAAALFAAFALAGRPQGKTITTKAELPATVPAAGPRCHRACARIGRHRRDQQGDRRGQRSRRSRRPSARTGPAGGPRSTCRTA